MPKKKGELPSGNIRRKIYDHSEPVFDAAGKPVIDPKTGKQKIKKVYISVTAGSAREAEIERAKILSNKENYKRPENMTLYEGIDRYIAENSALLSPTSISGYRTIQRNGFPHIMHKRLSELNNNTLRAAINTECKRSKNKRGTGTISAKTVKNEWELISAVINKYAPNIDTEVTLPQIVTKKNDLSTPEMIYQMVKDTAIELPVMLAMWLSFTESELIGLTKSKSISADGNYISVVEVIVPDEHYKPVVKQTGKRPKRNRTLELPPYLKGLIDQVEGDRLVNMSGSALSKRFSRLVKKSGIPYMTFHDLRHVNASVMTLLRVPDKYAQERGGWHTDHILKSVYQQTIAPERVAVDERIDDYFEGVVSEIKISPKYKHYLTLFDLEDNEKSREMFENFCIEQHILA